LLLIESRSYSFSIPFLNFYYISIESWSNCLN